MEDPSSAPVDVVDARFLFGLPRWKTLPEAPLAQVCFCGRSNVGKSSLLNCLAGRKALARVSNTPGRTQAINVFAVTLRRAEERRTMWFVDLPGYGFAEAPAEVRRQWKPMMLSYLKGNRHLRAAAALLDIRRKPSLEDRELLQLLTECEVPAIPVVTKADKVGKTQRTKHLNEIADSLGMGRGDLWAFSSETREGRADMLAALFELADPPPIPKS